MRGRDAIAVALRHPDGRIVTATERLDSRVHTARVGKWPFVRGLVVLYETLVIGTRWLVRSANVQAEEDDVELGKGTIAIMLLITFGVAIAVFSLLPLFISSVATSGSSQGWAQPAVEGLIQVGLFLGYLTLVSRTPDIYRVFQYHGAEHMTIHALEAGDPLTVDEVRKYPTAHHRCGTEFLVILVLLSIFAFSLVGKQEPLVMIAQPVPRHPGPRRGRLRDPQVRRQVPPQPGHPRDHVPRDPRPDDHDQAPDRRHDRGRDRLDGGGARAPTASRSPRARRSSTATRSCCPRTEDDRDQPANRWRRPRRTSRRRSRERPRREARRGRRAVRRPPGRAGAARGHRRPERDPPAWLASSPGSSRRSRPSGASTRPARSSPARASCATRSDGDDEMRARWPATRSTDLEGEERRSSRSCRSCCCRATRTTIAT